MASKSDFDIDFALDESKKIRNVECFESTQTNIANGLDASLKALRTTRNEIAETSREQAIEEVIIARDTYKTLGERIDADKTLVYSVRDNLPILVTGNQRYKYNISKENNFEELLSSSQPGYHSFRMSNENPSAPRGASGWIVGTFFKEATSGGSNSFGIFYITAQDEASHQFNWTIKTKSDYDANSWLGKSFADIEIKSTENVDTVLKKYVANGKNINTTQTVYINGGATNSPEKEFDNLQPGWSGTVAFFENGFSLNVYDIRGNMFSRGYDKTLEKVLGWSNTGEAWITIFKGERKVSPNTTVEFKRETFVGRGVRATLHNGQTFTRIFSTNSLGQNMSFPGFGGDHYGLRTSLEDNHVKVQTGNAGAAIIYLEVLA